MNVGRKETIKKYLRKKGCYCPDCGKLLSHQNSKRCRSCWVKWRLEGGGKLPPSQKGREHLYMIGEKNIKWKGGVTPENKAERQTLQYKKWREAVFERDNWTCQLCGQRGGKLNAHHKVPFCEDKKLRTDISNGITYCEKCHYIVDNKFYGNQYV